MTSRMVAGQLALALLTAACGADEDRVPELVGKWYAEDDGGFECGYGFVFHENGDFEWDYLCSLTGGGIGLEAYVGTYETDGASLTLRMTHSTCHGAEPSVDVVRHDIEGDTLQVTGSAGLTLYERVPESDGSDPTTGSVQFGCFRDDGAFVPGALVKL